MCILSLCMIIKNEQNVLERCLNSVKSLADEIIIVDTGSNDNSVKIAKKFTNKVYNFEWCDDFSMARNFAFSKASGKYIMWLDADDVVPKQSFQKLKQLKARLTADVYMLKYDIAFCDNKPTFSFYRERIIKNCKQAVWQGAVHECITPFGKVEKLDIAIWHKKIKVSDPMRNYKIYQKIVKTRTLSPREQYYFGRELFDCKKYYKSLSVLKKFVNSGLGWKENVIDALYLMSKICQILNRKNEAKNYLFETFNYDEPRANICCMLADMFLKDKLYKQAIWWYLTATKCKDISQNCGFCEPMYYNYYPYLQMCYCYFCLNDNNKAEFYNNLASKFNNSELVKYNKVFFENLKQKNR